MGTGNPIKTVKNACQRQTLPWGGLLRLSAYSWSCPEPEHQSRSTKNLAENCPLKPSPDIPAFSPRT